jgi:putative hydrolase of HD superfamily
MSILHDWAESKIGDFMPDEIGYDKKSELENYAMTEILESLPQTIQLDYQNIWDEFLARDTPESRLVHELDKLEMALQAKIYEKDVDPERVKPFIISAVEQIIDPDLKKILVDILK